MILLYKPPTMDASTQKLTDNNNNNNVLDGHVYPNVTIIS